MRCVGMVDGNDRAFLAQHSSRAHPRGRLYWAQGCSGKSDRTLVSPDSITPVAASAIVQAK